MAFVEQPSSFMTLFIEHLQQVKNILVKVILTVFFANYKNFENSEKIFSP